MIVFFVVTTIAATVWVDKYAAQTNLSNDTTVLLKAILFICCMTFVFSFGEQISNYAIWLIGWLTSRKVESVENAIDPVKQMIEPLKDDISKTLAEYRHWRKEFDGLEVDLKPFVSIVKVVAKHANDPDWDWNRLEKLIETGFKLAKSSIATAPVIQNGNGAPMQPPAPTPTTTIILSDLENGDKWEMT